MKKKILLVDDEPNNLQLLRQILRSSRKPLLNGRKRRQSLLCAMALPFSRLPIPGFQTHCDIFPIRPYGCSVKGIPSYLTSQLK